MNKSALKKFAVTARRKLEEAIKQKAYTFGITEEGMQPLEELRDGLIVNGEVMGERELKQYNHLKNRIVTEGYQKVMDEAAYTWFNRFVAMRYMEVNDFLPIHMRILSSENPNKSEPDALTKITSLADELEMDLERIYDMQDANKLNQLYEYLIIKQSIKLGDILPNVFDPITDDLALLIPNNLLNETSIVRDIITMVDEEDWKEVEIVGWLYQYYISEEKESFFANRSKKAGKEDIPAATQLFTPRWIVEYMVDNSLGRLWLENYDDNSIKESLTYYLDEEQTEVVKDKIDSLNNQSIDIEKLSFFDPSCGSGHILVYAFELFYKLYLSRGYRERDIPSLILKNNLYGLDIDKRATQLATFAIVMKAREYDKRLFNRDYTINIYSIEESNVITTEQVDFFSNGNDEIKEAIERLIETFYDGKLYGSIIQVPDIDIALIKEQIESIRNGERFDLLTIELIEYIFPLIEDLISQYNLLERQYDVVVTNPPYMGNFNNDLKKYINTNYKDFKKDMFSVFIYRCSLLAKEHGYTGFMTPMVWMFISSYETLRKRIVKNKTISSLVQLEYSAFEEATVPLCTFVLRNNHVDPHGTYIRLTDFRGGMKVQEEKYLEAVNNPEISYRYKTNSDNFSKIPGSPIAYWATQRVINVFEEAINLNEIVEPRLGMATASNETFMRFWYEVVHEKIKVNSINSHDAKASKSKWFPYDKGGAYRKWYGNNFFVVDWENDGYNIRNFKSNTGKIRSHNYNLDHIFKKGITWSALTAGSFSSRITPVGHLFDNAGSKMFTEDKYLYYIQGFLSTSIVNKLLPLINPTLNYQPGTLSSIPLIIDYEKASIVNNIVKKSVLYSKSDWDSFETSWDFEKHPFLTYKEESSLIKDSFEKWEEVAEERFYQLKENEEELNRIFIDIYGLQDELTPEVEEKDVTVRKEDRERDIKSFLSYLVGLMFGRYSLDKKGLAYAGGEWDPSLYTTFQPDENNIIPITQDQYFEDDIVKKIEELLEVIYGRESLEDNLSYIAQSLKKKANQSARERIREYFIKDFYKDHVRTYQKRPIYWQFNSGRRGAFKGLMYLHRYDKDTIGRLRTEYVLQESKVLENMMGYEEQILNDDTSTQQQKARVQKIIENHMKDREELAIYSEVVNHVARKQIELDLDDGVKVNYEKFQNNELITSETTKPIKQNIFDKL